MHPLIQKYLDFEINGKYPQPPEDYIPQNEIDKAVITIWWLINDVTRKKAQDIAKVDAKILLEATIILDCDAETYYWLLSAWHFASVLHPPYYSETDRVGALIIDLPKEKVHPLIIAASYQNFYYYYLGRKRDVSIAKEYLDKYLLLTKNFPNMFYLSMVENFTIGMPIELQLSDEQLIHLFRNGQDQDKEFIPLILFSWHASKSNFIKALFYLQQMPNKKLKEDWKSRVYHSIEKLYVQLLIYHLGDHEIQNLDEIKTILDKYRLNSIKPKDEFALIYESISQINLALSKKQLGKATSITEEMYKKYGRIAIANTHTLEYHTVLLNIELCNRNLNNAEILFASYCASYSFKYLDLRLFFKTRVHLLKKEFLDAKRCFFEVKNYFYKYDAKNILKYLIMFSLEISTNDLIELFSYDPKVDDQLKPQPSLTQISAKTIEIMGFVKGISQATKQLNADIDRAANSNIPVLILGETGVGKELTAETIHQNSSLKSKPFLAINCNSISDTLIESELFGHIKGSFTGASNDRAGLFETAGEGTIFLDEIGDISLQIQASLLRVLDTGEIKPVGSSKTKKIKCRILAATNANLEDKIAKGLFRQDLFYRLNRLVINIKPLRERKEDILFLSKYFVEYFLKTTEIDFAIAAKEALTSYPWPGNVRELRNVMERMCLYNSNKKIFDLIDIDPKIASGYSTIHPIATNDRLADQVNNANSNTRYDKLKELFVTFNKLTRKEIVRLTGLSEPTATNYLKQLTNENFIKKIEPNDSPRSHYFIIVK